MYLRIPLPILGGGGSANDGDIHNGAVWQQQTLLSQILPYCLEDLLSQMVLLQNLADAGNINPVIFFTKLRSHSAAAQLTLLAHHSLFFNSYPSWSLPQEEGGSPGVL